MSQIEALFAHHNQCLFSWVEHLFCHSVFLVAGFGTYILEKTNIDNTNNYGFCLQILRFFECKNYGFYSGDTTVSLEGKLRTR